MTSLQIPAVSWLYILRNQVMSFYSDVFKFPIIPTHISHIPHKYTLQNGLTLLETVSSHRPLLFILELVQERDVAPS